VDRSIPSHVAQASGGARKELIRERRVVDSSGENERAHHCRERDVGSVAGLAGTARHRSRQPVKVSTHVVCVGGARILVAARNVIEIDMAMKRKAIERCAPPAPGPEGESRWQAAKTSSNGSKTSEPPKVMLSSAQPAILLTPPTPDSQTP
jgi:hypothetical protein